MNINSGFGFTAPKPMRDSGCGKPMERNNKNYSIYFIIILALMLISWTTCFVTIIMK